MTDVERYEICQKFKNIIEKQAKQNQSDGGKGLSNLKKVNVTEEMANKVGVSTGTYYKLDKVMKSEREEVKQKLREKKISIDKAYKEMISDKPTEPLVETPMVTPEQKIKEFDDRLDTIKDEINVLEEEKKSIIRRRTALFERLSIKCPIKYEWKRSTLLSEEYRIYIEYEGHDESLFEGDVLCDEKPDNFYLNKVSEKYKHDFLMIWSAVHKEAKVKHEQRIDDWLNTNNTNGGIGVDIDKSYLKKFFKILATEFHPDNKNGDLATMQILNQLKAQWGV